ncbi:MAG: matrixin family metalloprotease [Verrucomicrobiota bacterium]|nr:matrixin family metalloprotease [Verrucomicrobiota bacterium]
MSTPSRRPSAASSASSKPRLRRSLAVFAALAIIASPAFGYVYVTSDASRWPGPTIGINVQLGAAPRILQDGSLSYNASFENAMRLWNEQIARAQFTWVESPRTVAPSSNNVTTISFEQRIYNDDLGTRTLAITQVRASGGRIIEADMAFNSSKVWDSYFGTLDAQPNEDIHRVALHELGHVLGLDHPDTARQIVNAIMNSHVNDADRLQADDVNGARSLYGAPANPPPPSSFGRLASISTRGRVGTGESVLIGGFAIKDASKRVLVRGIGPSLPLANDLADPLLTLHNANGDILALNDNWKDTQRADIEATGNPPQFDREAAIVATLPAGQFTTILRGQNATTGRALVEVYNLTPESGQVGSISTRGFVGTGDDVLIGGFIIDGPGSKVVVLRGIGPSLATSFGVAGALQDTRLQLFNGNSAVLLSNTGWQNGGSAALFYGLAPPNDRESAITVELTPGAYTVILSSPTNSSGIGLVEIYDVSP